MALKRKIAYIDLSAGTFKTSPIPVMLRNLFLGGRGIDAYLLYNHCPKGIDAFDPQNPLIISAGLLVGTLASASARTHVMAKSPLTNLVGSSNMGGFFAPELRWAGFDHLVITGKAQKPVYLWINDGKIEIKSAKSIWGLSPLDAQESIRKELRDEEIQVLTIGIAGENLVRFANVRTGLKNAAGRTGLGAILGSKNLKAVAVRGTLDIEIAHPEEALKYDEELIRSITSTKFGKIMQKWGTAFIYGVTNSTGLVRTRNFQTNQHTDSEDIECERIEDYSFGTEGCFGCGLHCRHRYILKKEPFKGVYAQGPEYTSQGAFGAEVGCRSMDTVLAGNHLVNYYGLDTLETGSLMAWAFELYEKGIITDEDTGGLELRWGNDEAVLKLIEMIAKREGIGGIIAEGPLRAAAKIGKNSERYLIHVKGMSNLHSDERPTPSLALGIATASRGSDHLRSRPAIDLYFLPEPVLRKIYSNPVPYDGPLSSSYLDYEGKPWQVIWHEMCYAAIDCLGICKFHTTFLSPNMPNFDEFSELIYLNTNLEISPKEIWTVAERVYNLERLFNISEGATRKDDWLVDRYFEEPTPSGLEIVKGKTIDRKKLKAMLDEYYKLHGWDNNGVPEKETLKRLSLDQEPTHKL
ncbi:MAG: aldehyde ferredoxin oxidoreductase family protein [Planctomycetota bacterium]